MPPRKTSSQVPGANASGARIDGTSSSQSNTTTLPSRPGPMAKSRSVTSSGDKGAAEDTTAIPPSPTALNTPSTQPLDFFIFGDGSQSELGLGNRLSSDGKKPVRVSRPRLHHLLNEAGVVQVACGGMHSIALTHDNRILTWGINDDKNLARDTTWTPTSPNNNTNQNNEDKEDFEGLNPHESLPLEITYGPSLSRTTTTFTQVAASSSASFVLTSTGAVYGWGTFRTSTGDGKPSGFLSSTITTTTTIASTAAEDTPKHQTTPILIPGLPQSITKLACGSDHVLALDVSGRVWSWGAAQQGQLGRRIFLTRSASRSRGDDVGNDDNAALQRIGMTPQLVNLPFSISKNRYVTDIAAGSWHSFIIDNHGTLYGFGMNNFSQAGRARHVRADGKGEGQGAAVVELPTKLDAFGGVPVRCVDGGQHHSVVCTVDGRLWSWGRVDGRQTGHSDDVYDEGNAVFDGMGRARILVKPSVLERLEGGVVHVAAGTDTSFAVTEKGEVYSWGFTGAFQAGHGPPLRDANGNDRDVEVPKKIENSALRNRKIVWAGAGGQFSMLAALIE